MKFGLPGLTLALGALVLAVGLTLATPHSVRATTEPLCNSVNLEVCAATTTCKDRDPLTGRCFWIETAYVYWN